MGEYLVEDLVFTNIKPEKIDVDDNGNEVDMGREIQRMDISDENVSEISRDLEGVKDDDLRKILLKVQINDEKFKKYRIVINFR